MPTGRKAYSYIRFSTVEQQMGSSLRRQVQDCQNWCRANGLTLDSSHIDRGVSAFRRRNATRGALGVFLEHVRAGEIEVGSVLVVENINRLTRAEPLDAFDLLREIIRAGIELVTLHDGQRYTSASMREIGPLIHALVLMAGAHQESANKSAWISSAWQIKRDAAQAEGRPMTRQVPAWLRVDGVRAVGNRQDWSAAKFTTIPERVEVLRQIFEWRATGWGRRRIASELISRGIPVWGRGKRRAKGGWQESYIHKLLTTRAVLGEYQPHKLENGRYSPRVKVGKALPNYYPQVIDLDLWESAQAHNEEARPRAGRPSTVLLSGLLVDSNGAPMHVERKGEGCDYYATSRAFRRTGKPVLRWRLDHLDACVLQLVRGIEWDRILRDDSRQPELRSLRGKLVEVSRQEAGVRAKIAHAAKALLVDLGALGDALQAQALALTADLAKLTTEKLQLESSIREIERAAVVASDSSALAKHLGGELTDEKRVRLRVQLRRLVRRIQVWPDGHTPDTYWKHAVREAGKALVGNRGLVAKAGGKVAGALRFFFVGGKEITAYVTYRPGARSDREPRVIAFASPVGMSLADWLEIAAHVRWGLRSVTVETEVS